MMCIYFFSTFLHIKGLDNQDTFENKVGQMMQLCLKYPKNVFFSLYVIWEIVGILLFTMYNTFIVTFVFSSKQVQVIYLFTLRTEFYESCCC